MSSPAPDLLQRLRTLLVEGPSLRLAVLFGSRIKGGARPSSDFDIGIIPVDRHLSLHVEFGLASALSEVVRAEVDLVRLDTDDPILGREVARHGLCLFEEEAGMFAAYRATAISR
ncbi:MAG TPA: nucleotidyltransferase domain-containing protein, partial [Polyangiaceae bacterium]|nr:nucleotidyltransferase domain-containing protein [Polyangiaceae bacterium]